MIDIIKEVGGIIVSPAVQTLITFIKDGEMYPELVLAAMLVESQVWIWASVTLVNA